MIIKLFKKRLNLKEATSWKKQRFQSNMPSEMFNRNIKESLNQPLLKTTPPWDYFPAYAEELFHIISIMPRQLLELSENQFPQAIYSLERETSDGVLKLDWKVNCLFRDITDANILELFYQIETLFIRPLIIENYPTLKRCLPLGTLSEIAGRIGIDEQNLESIKKALYFGASIRIDLLINPTKAKRKVKNSLADESLDSGFNLFDLYSSSAAAAYLSTRQENGEKQQSDDEMILIFPSSDYVKILNTNLKIENNVELSRISPLVRRLLEILYWKALIDEQGKISNQDENSQISISTDELIELFPLRNLTKLEEALKEIESLNLHYKRSQTNEL